MVLSLAAGLAISGIASGLGGILGSKAQSKALSKAGKAQAAYQQQIMKLYTQIFEEGKPFREAATEMLGLVVDEANREPGTGQLFERGLSKGTERLASEFSKYGLLDSSSFGVASGELTADLLSRDIESIRGTRQSLLSGINTGVPGATQTLGLAGGPVNAQSQILGQQGAVSGALYGGLGNIIGGLALAGTEGINPLLTGTQGTVTNNLDLGGSLRSRTRVNVGAPVNFSDKYDLQIGG